MSNHNPASGPDAGSAARVLLVEDNDWPPAGDWPGCSKPGVSM